MLWITDQNWKTQNYFYKFWWLEGHNNCLYIFFKSWTIFFYLIIESKLGGSYKKPNLKYMKVFIFFKYIRAFCQKKKWTLWELESFFVCVFCHCRCQVASRYLHCRDIMELILALDKTLKISPVFACRLCFSFLKHNSDPTPLFS